MARSLQFQSNLPNELSPKGFWVSVLSPHLNKEEPSFYLESIRLSLFGIHMPKNHTRFMILLHTKLSFQEMLSSMNNAFHITLGLPYI